MELHKEAETEEVATKAVLVLTEEKDVLVHTNENSVAFIPLLERKKNAISISWK